jgi:ribose 5-phosphate isomerase A
MTGARRSINGASEFARERREAAEIAAQLIEPHMRVGLGSGVTVEAFLPALARRRLGGLRCVATSLRTQRLAVELGIAVEPFTALERLDVAVDWADQIAPDGWIIKGGHGAHLREKVVAAASARYVVIASSEKLVDRLAPPIPVEILSFGVRSTLNILRTARIRAGARPTADSGILADVCEDFDDPAVLAARLDSTPGVVGHGLFDPELVHDFVIPGGHRPGLRAKP